MVGLSHVILHVGLCTAAARANPDATIAMRVRVTARVGEPTIDTTFRFPRGSDPQSTVEFDAPPGIYRLTLDVPKYRCTASDFLEFIADHNRTFAETLDDGPPAPPEPVVLLHGTAPQSFQSVRPTFVLFDDSVACNQPVKTPLPTRLTVENERDAYYVWLHFDPTAPAPKSTLALRLRTPTGLYHYIRLPVPFPPRWGNWPDTVRFNVTEDELASLATEKTDTLLCPKIWETSVG